MWDLFLSYNRTDRAAIDRIRLALQARGLATFIDREQLPAGVPWQEGLERGLRDSRAVAVFLGAGGLTYWQCREKDFALSLQGELEKTGTVYPVIPVLLDGAELAPGFLFQNGWIDLRDPAGFDDELTRLVAAVRREPVTASPVVDVCPYRGLRAFGREDAALYMGRAEYAEKLLAKVQRRDLRFIAVTGKSGSGKSSLVAAGLVPLLLQQRPPLPAWDVASFSPGDDPWRHLAATLVALLEPDADSVTRICAAGRLRGELSAGRGGLEHTVRAILSPPRGADRLLLVVDQFEDLFRLTPEPVRAPFIEALLRAADAEALTVLITLRIDFLGAAVDLSPVLTERLNRDGAQLIPRAMGRDALADAIEQPARRVGLIFEAGLVDRIVADVGLRNDALPLLEYALTELWRGRSVRTLTHSAYDAIGGVTGALGARAESVFAALNEAQRTACARLFTSLVRLAESDEEGADTRVPARRADIGELAWAAAERFAAPDVRLLALSADVTTRDELVEIAHEALIRRWPRFQDWLHTDREFLLWRQELRRDLARWERTGRSDDSLLRGPALDAALRWLEARGGELTDDERWYVSRPVSDEYHVEKAVAEAAQIVRFASGATLANWGAVMAWRAGASQDLQRVSGEDDAIHSRLARIASALGEHEHALASALRIAERWDQALTIVALVRPIVTLDDTERAAPLVREIERMLVDGKRCDDPEVDGDIVHTRGDRLLMALGLQVADTAAERWIDACIAQRSDRATAAVTRMVIDGLLGAGRRAAALRLARSRPTAELRVKALLQIAETGDVAEVAAAAWTEAQRVYGMLEHDAARALALVARTAGPAAALTHAGVLLNAGTRAIALAAAAAIVATSAHAGSAEPLHVEARRLLGRLGEVSDATDAADRVIRLLIDGRVIPSALAIARDASDPALRAHRLTVAATALAATVEASTAAEVAREALEVAEAAGSRDVAATRSSAVIVLARMWGALRTIALIERVSDATEQVRLMIDAMRTLVRRGDEPGARKIASLALAQAKRTPVHRDLHDEVYIAIREEDLDRVLSGYGSTWHPGCPALLRALEPFPFVRAIYERWSVSDDTSAFARIIRRIHEVSDRHERDTLIAQMSTSLAESGFVWYGLILVDHIDNVELRIARMCDLMPVVTRHGRHGAVVELAKAAIQLDESANNGRQLAEILRTLLELRFDQHALSLARSSSLRSRAIGIVAYWLVSHDRLDDAMGLDDALASTGNDFLRAEVCARLIRSGRFRDAAQVARLGSYSAERVRLVIPIVRAAIAAGSFELAVQLAHETGSDAVKASACIEMAAASRIEEAVSMVSVLSEPTQRTWALADIAIICARAGDATHAVALAAAAESAAHDMRAYDDRGAAWRRVAVAWARLHRYRDALAAAARCYPPNNQLHAYTAIVVAHLAQRHPALASPLDDMLDMARE